MKEFVSFWVMLVLLIGCIMPFGLFVVDAFSRKGKFLKTRLAKIEVGLFVVFLFTSIMYFNFENSVKKTEFVLNESLYKSATLMSVTHVRANVYMVKVKTEKGVFIEDKRNCHFNQTDGPGRIERQVVNYASSRAKFSLLHVKHLSFYEVYLPKAQMKKL